MTNIENLDKKLISPKNKELLQSMTEEIIERMSITSEGQTGMTPDQLVQGMVRALKNHGVKSNIEDYMVELLPMIDKTIKKMDEAPKKRKKPERKKGFSHLVDVCEETSPDIVTIESLGIEISFRLTRDEQGKEKLEEIDRHKLDSRNADPEASRFTPEIYNYIIKTAWAVIRKRQKQRNK